MDTRTEPGGVHQMIWIAAASCLLAFLPAVLFVWNLAFYLPSPHPSKQITSSCSVLIPARNEEVTIAQAVFSVLRNQTANFELIVFDDHSEDRTAEIVREIVRTDRRVRLATGLPLPEGWCGKQHACYLLSRLARHPLLVFMDADVRLMPDALVRMTEFMNQSGAALASGVPRQETETFSERLLIPLVHFVLLGFLPLGRMRASRLPAYGAGCGQLFIARRDAYQACGGHSAIRETLHDGPKLPRAFRAAGFPTDLFDATDIAECRMYATNQEVWRGLAKNAHEALGSPRLIGFATLLLLGGQVVPLCLLFAACLQMPRSPLLITVSIIGLSASFLPRLLGVALFRQPLSSALLHPLGICGLLAIQWFGFFRSLRRRPTLWKGRAYSSVQPAP